MSRFIVLALIFLGGDVVDKKRTTRDIQNENMILPRKTKTSDLTFREFRNIASISESKTRATSVLLGVGHAMLRVTDGVVRILSALLE